MKKLSLLIMIMAMGIFAVNTVTAQDVEAGDVLGIWLNEDEDAQIKIYQEDDKYFGKIIWLRDPIDEETGKPKTDKENPDESLRNVPTLGLLILKNFEFDEDEWNDGTIYDPKSGKTYSCYMIFPDGKEKLKIRGYIGISLLGRTSYWTREKGQNKME